MDVRVGRGLLIILARKSGSKHRTTMFTADGARIAGDRIVKDSNFMYENVNVRKKIQMMSEYVPCMVCSCASANVCAMNMRIQPRVRMYCKE